jgi:predicted PurR-regulated permease PerM
MAESLADNGRQGQAEETVVVLETSEGSPAPAASPPVPEETLIRPVEIAPTESVIVVEEQTEATIPIVPPEPFLSASARPFGLPKRDWQRLLALTLAVIVGLLFLWQVQSILPPFIIAFFLASMLDPTIRYLEAHGRSRVRAILTLYVLSFCLVSLFLMRVVPPVIDQTDELSKNFNSYYTHVTKTADSYLSRNKKLLNLLGIKQQRVSDIFSQKSGPVMATVNSALGGLTGFLQNAASKMLWLIIIPVATFFMLRDYTVLRARAISLFPDAYQSQADIMSREIVDVFSAYIRGLAKVCALFAVAAFLLFQALGLKYALFLGLVAGAFYAVPYVGQLFTSVVSGAVAYSMGPHRALLFLHIPANSTSYALTVVLCAVIAQNLFDQIIYPRVVGASVGLHPVVSIFALMAGATLFGILGMLVAVPVAASIQILLVYCFPKLTQPPPQRLLEPTPPLA